MVLVAVLAAAVDAAGADLGAGLDLRRRLPPYRLQVWTPDHGLPQNTVTSLVQTRDGALVLGTHGGLARFNGVVFAVFDRANTPELASNLVSCLLEDSGGRLWIGTESGGLTWYHQGTFTTLGGELAGAHIRCLQQDSAGRVWVGTRDRGLWLWEHDELRPWPLPAEVATTDLRAVAADPGGALWIGTEGHGVIRLEGERVSRLTAVDGLPDDHVRALVVAADGSLWIGTAGGLLARLDGGRIEMVNLDRAALHSPITVLSKLSDGTILVGTHGAGVAAVRGTAVTRIDSSRGLSHDVVYAVLEDREGSLWVGTNGGGLNQLARTRFRVLDRRAGLPSDMVFPVLEDRLGALWIGSEGGGLARVGPTGTTVISAADGLADDKVFALFEDHRGDLWVGTYGGGLNRLREGRIETFTTADGLAGNFISALTEDCAGRLWVGTDGGGLARLDRGGFEVVDSRSGLSNDRVTVLAPSRDGSVWVGTYGGGLNHVQDGRVEVWDHRRGLSSDVVLSLLEDPDGTLWIGTVGGLNRLEGGRIESCTRRDGLFDDVVFRILDDGHGWLWMSCNRGLFRVGRADLDRFMDGNAAGVSSVAYGRSDGMPSAQCNGVATPAGVQTRDGLLLFPTVRGVVVVDPLDLQGSPVVPPVVVERLTADGVDQNLHQPVLLEGGTHTVEIQYAGLSYRAPEGVRYRYRLEGLSPQWEEVETRRVASFAGLPPGNYRFEVVACNGDGLWNAEGAAVNFGIRQQLHQRSGVRLLVGLVLLSAGVALHRLRLRQVRRRELELERLVRARTREVEETNQQLEQANRELERLASLDGLTGLYNRRLLVELLVKEWRRAVRERRPLAVLMIDVDCFKAFNDTYGHQAGDACLQAVAQVVLDTLSRPGDLAGRYGGEEFVAVLPGTPLEGALTVAEEIRRRVEGLAIDHAASSAAAVVTVSVGAAAAVPGPTSSQQRILGAADEALYSAKRRGRNRVVGAEVEPQIRAVFAG